MEKNFANILQSLIGLVWSVNQLQKLIPDGKEWDNKAQSIANHKAFAERQIALFQTIQYPFEAEIMSNGEKFAPTMFDFENKMVWRQTSQVSGGGEWVSLSDVTLTPNPYFHF